MGDPIPNNLSAACLFDVRDKVVLITEGCSSTGVIIAATLVENGAKVYLASKEETALQEVGYLLLVLSRLLKLV
jgi:short-subunit dehydrogenase involved in D-alanine esterification of teichoic acids